MANFGTHAAVGAGVGLGVYALFKYVKKEPWTWEDALGSAGLGLMTASLPDALEPALHPDHRALAHSIAALLSAIYGTKRLLDAPSVDGQTKVAGTVAAAGFVSHLLLDAGTPKGLPLLGI